MLNINKYTVVQIMVPDLSSRYEKDSPEWQAAVDLETTCDFNNMTSVGNMMQTHSQPLWFYKGMLTILLAKHNVRLVDVLNEVIK